MAGSQLLRSLAAGEIESAQLPQTFESLEREAPAFQPEDFRQVFDDLTSAITTGVVDAHFDRFWDTLIVIMSNAIVHHAASQALDMARQGVQYCKTTSQPASNLRKWYTTLAIIHTEANQPIESIDAHLKARELAIQLGEPKTEASCLVNVMPALLQLGLYAEGAAIGADVQARAWDLLTETEERPLRSGLLVNLAECDLGRHRYDEALRSARKAFDIYPAPTTSAGKSRKLTRIAILAKALACLGRYAEAFDVLQEADRVGEAGDRGLLVMAEARGVVLGRVGRHEEAIEILETTIDRFRHGGRLRELRAILARVYEGAGRFEDARRCFSQLSAEVREDRVQGIQAKLREARPNLATEPSITFDGYKSRVDAAAAEAAHFDLSAGMLQRLADMALLQIDQSGTRAYRVAKLAALVFLETGASIGECSWLETAARLIDVGYAELPPNILSRPAKLTPAETDLVQHHAEAGSHFIGHDTPALTRAARLVRSHHERWDGRGYPDHLAGDAIPIEARVVALADSFDALTHARPWRPAVGIHESLQIIEDAAGTQFDPQLTPQFSRLVSRLSREHPSLDDFLARGAAGTPAVSMRGRLLSSLRVDAALGTLRVDAQLQPAPEAPQA